MMKDVYGREDEEERIEGRKAAGSNPWLAIQGTGSYNCAWTLTHFAGWFWCGSHKKSNQYLIYLLNLTFFKEVLKYAKLEGGVCVCLRKTLMHVTSVHTTHLLTHP